MRHGTHGGYVLHRRRGEDACTACLAAHSVYQNGLTSQQMAARAHSRARMEVVRRYRGLYRRLVAQYLAEEKAALADRVNGRAS